MEASLKEINDVAAKLALQLEGNREVTRQITEKAKLLQAAQQRLQSITAENQQRKITFEWSEQQSELAGRVDELTEENATLAEMIKEYQHTLDTLMAKHKSLSASWKAERQEIQQHTDRMVEAERAKNLDLQRENAALRAKMQDMMQVMREAAVADEEENETEAAIEALQRENAALRAMLDIAGGVSPAAVEAATALPNGSV